MRVSNVANGKSVIVRVTDRGPFHADRVIDLSYAAAYRLGYVDNGSTQVEVEAEIEAEADEEAALSSIERASLEREAKRFAQRQGYVVDWDAVGQLDDATLVNGIAQVAPFDAAAKQALLETGPLDARADLVVQLMQFFGRFDGEDGRATLQ